MECLAGLPTELVSDFGRVDGVAEVVAGAVRDEGDERRVRLWSRVEFVEQRANVLHQFEVGQLVVAADVIGLARRAFFEHGAERRAMVADIEPVADVLAFSVNGDRFAAKAFENDDGDELFGKLIGAVVVGAVGDENGEAVGVAPGAGEVVG